MSREGKTQIFVKNHKRLTKSKTKKKCDDNNGDKVNDDLRTVTYFTSRASAIIPAARGAEADVPVCLMVHVFFRFVVACEIQQEESQQCCILLLFHIAATGLTPGGSSTSSN